MAKISKPPAGLTGMSATQRINLIGEIFKIALDSTESFEVNDVGAHLAYLMGSISLDDSYAADQDFMESQFREILEDNCPEEHDVWRFIQPLED